MLKGRSRKRKTMKKKPAALLISLMILLSVSVTGTVAYLFSVTQPVTNIFEAANVTNKVAEEFTDGITKKNVGIQNTGNVDAYIRAAVVVTWVKNVDAAANSSEVYAMQPQEGTDYQMDWIKNNWVEGSDGYYYYLKPVKSGDITGTLFTNCSAVSATVPTGYQLSVEVTGQSIQADGVSKISNKHPVEEAWPIVTVETDGTLSVRTK